MTADDAVTGDPRSAIDRVTLIVSDLDHAVDDYVRTFGFSAGEEGDIDPALSRVLGIPGARGRRALLRLGGQRIEMLAFKGPAGRPYPPDSTATDLWFQHMAIVVSDMAHAHELVMASGRFQPISPAGPVRLPDNTGGVCAFKFRDHDGHPLELLAFPAEKARGAPGTNGSGPFLGIDHTAISVSDSADSTRFFGSVFGFGRGNHTHNHGPEQASLDNVADVAVSVTQLAPELAAPRLELLRYHVGTRRPILPDTAGNDLAATYCAVRVASLDATLAGLARCGLPVASEDLITLPGGIRAALVTGPDGHRFLAEEAAVAPLARCQRV